MAERHDPEEQTEEQRHKIRLWEDFCARAVEAGNRAIEYLELGDVDGDYSDEELDEIYLARWESSGVIIESVFNHLWPEIEGLAIKLGVPFVSEVAALYGDKND